jgi:hypothetical protein
MSSRGMNPGEMGKHSDEAKIKVHGNFTGFLHQP